MSAVIKNSKRCSNFSEHLLSELKPSERNALRHVLLSESGLLDLRIALGIHRVRVISLHDERTAHALKGTTASLFGKNHAVLDDIKVTH
jgi:hypothetical protein